MEFEKSNLGSIGIEVADHISAMLAYWDKDLVCRFANASYQKWFGKTRDDMVNKITLIELLGSLYQANKPYIDAALGGNPQTFEREIPTPDGTIRHALVNYTPDINNGEVAGFFVHAADISSVKKLEYQLIKSNEKVIEQNKNLLNFAFIVSHNLKTYAGNLDAILHYLIEADTEDSKNEMIEHLLSISSGFSSTVDNLSQIVRSQSQSNIAPVEIRLYAYIEKVIESLSIQIQHNKARVINHVNPNIRLEANAVYMESIILNFLTNAIKYKHPEREPLIELDASYVKDEIVLRIKDNGIGIDMEKYGNKLFGIYNTFHGNDDAQGIGLYITKNQIQAMNGRVEVESKVNEGSTFTIYFKAPEQED